MALRPMPIRGGAKPVDMTKQIAPPPPAAKSGKTVSTSYNIPLSTPNQSFALADNRPCLPSALYHAVLMHVAYDERAKWGEWTQALADLAAALPSALVLDQSISQAIGSDEEAAKVGVCLALMDLHRAQLATQGSDQSPYTALRNVLDYSFDLEDDAAEISDALRNALEFTRYCESLVLAMRQQMRSYWSGIECMDTQTLIKCALRGAIRMKHMAAWLNKQPPGGQPASLAISYCGVTNSLGLPAADPLGWMEVVQWQSLQMAEPILSTVHNSRAVDTPYEDWPNVPSTLHDDDDIPWGD